MAPAADVVFPTSGPSANLIAASNGFTIVTTGVYWIEWSAVTADAFTLAIRRNGAPIPGSQTSRSAVATATMTTHAVLVSLNAADIITLGNIGATPITLDTPAPGVSASIAAIRIG